MKTAIKLSNKEKLCEDCPTAEECPTPSCPTCPTCPEEKTCPTGEGNCPECPPTEVCPRVLSEMDMLTNDPVINKFMISSFDFFKDFACKQNPQKIIDEIIEGINKTNKRNTCSGLINQIETSLVRQKESLKRMQSNETNTNKDDNGLETVRVETDPDYIKQVSVEVEYTERYLLPFLKKNQKKYCSGDDKLDAKKLELLLRTFVQKMCENGEVQTQVVENYTKKSKRIDPVVVFMLIILITLFINFYYN
jgi:hypothetical protein